jgi:uncharacterized protein (TIGR03086 family)
MSSAAEAMAMIVRGISSDQLTAPTSCTEYDVRGLVHHLLFWGPSLEGAGHKKNVPPPAAVESDVDLTSGDWRGHLLAQLTHITRAWASASAWEGTTYMGRPTELPASLVGDMILGELVVHSWDLAQATDQRLDLDEELLTHVHDAMAPGVAQGREMGMYGTEVPVPATAPTLDRILGLTGRDPAWGSANPTVPSAAH